MDEKDKYMKWNENNYNTYKILLKYILTLHFYCNVFSYLLFNIIT